MNISLLMPQALLVVSFLKLVAIIMAQSKLTTFFKSAASNDKYFTCSYETRYVTYMYHKLDGKAESDVEADIYNCISDEKESGSEHEEGGCSTCAQCECLSCTMSGPPCQPIDVSKSKHVYSHKSQHTAKKKSYSRSIQPSWYKKHPWITVRTTKYKIFCHSCSYSRKKGLLTFSKRN